MNDKDRAVSVTAHGFASVVHYGLAQMRMTPDELKEILGCDDWHPEMVDHVLSGKHPEEVTCCYMAAVAYALKFDLSIALRPIPAPPEKKEEAAR